MEGISEGSTVLNLVKMNLVFTLVPEYISQTPAFLVNVPVRSSWCT